MYLLHLGKIFTIPLEYVDTGYKHIHADLFDI